MSIISLTCVLVTYLRFPLSLPVSVHLPYPNDITQPVYTQRHDDRYGGMVPSKKQKRKMAILKITFKKRTDRCSLFGSS